MAFTRLPYFILAATCAWSLPSSAQVKPLPHSKEAESRQAGQDEEENLPLTLARMIRAKTDLSWLVSPSDAARIATTADERAEARSIIVLAAVGRSRGLDLDSSTNAALHALKTMVLAEAVRRDLLDSIKVSDSDVIGAIRRQQGRYDEYRLSHIFVAVGETRDGRVRSDNVAKEKALDLKRRIENGEDFAALARENSDDTSTAAGGGGLPSMFGRYMADAFFPHVRSMSVGAVSDPIRADQGYHLVRLEERIPATTISARFMATEDIRSARMPTLIDGVLRGYQP